VVAPKSFPRKLFVLVGKTVPTYDFNNVIKPVPVNSEKLSIPAVTAPIYTPVFVNTSVLGNLPGYYNSAYGVTTTFALLPQFYLSYGVYGDLARGIQTGLQTTPHFTGYYFQIGEAGYAWLLRPNKLPGNIGAGGWGQTGRILHQIRVDRHSPRPEFPSSHQNGQVATPNPPQALKLRPLSILLTVHCITSSPC
jgi:hypothetical protein